MPHIGQPRKYVKIFKLIHFNKSKIERETQREREGGDIENPFEMQPAWILPHWPVGNRNICTKAGPEKETTELAQLSSAQHGLGHGHGLHPYSFGWLAKFGYRFM